ncbi:MAG: hypothetical protein L3J98_09715 [Gammaproteobacteria bacterium]|nr:hypothetical protein [Gammaproteobacteria bacterium]MCF6260420.1 hypothetical protein [Gammaproteobacteria bacterium]
MLIKEHCSHFSMLPIGMRVMFTGTLVVLGVGYLFAMIYIFASHAGRDGNPNLSVDDLIIAYSGSKSDTRLEGALKGPMANMLPQNERDEIIAWVRRGAEQEEYTTRIEPIIEKRCMVCHNGSNPHIASLKKYEDIMLMAELDTGMDIFTLVRVSHIHLFGITFIFYIVGSIFCHAYIKLVWLKCALIATPFLAIVLDIGSWYLTKVYPPFAWVVMVSGVLMGVSFAVQWVISIYQMWFYTLPEDVQKSGGHVS